MREEEGGRQAEQGQGGENVPPLVLTMGREDRGRESRGRLKPSLQDTQRVRGYCGNRLLYICICGHASEGAYMRE